MSAPRAGTVTAVLVQQGQFVAAGTPLLSILPEATQLDVHLFGESRKIVFMHEQAHVMLRPQQDGPPKAGILPCDNGLHPEQGGRCGFQRIAIDVIMLHSRKSNPFEDSLTQA